MIVDIARLAEDEAYRQDARHRFITDHFFAAEIIGYYDFSERAHRPAVNIYFPKNPNLPIREQHRKHKRIHLDPRHTFKALALDTRIPTPTGFTTMGTVKVGDRVFSENGQVCNVIGCSPVFESHTCYEILFSTGQKLVADAGHLWVTDSRRDRERKQIKLKECPRVRSTEEIALTLMCRDERNHRIKLASPLELPDIDLPISPYVLGCWLGDGCKTGQSITCGEKALVEEILKEGETLRYAGLFDNDPYKYVFNGGIDHPDYRMRSGKSFASRIRNLDLYKNKHIPMIYRRSSHAQRLALLQGLMDTDGTVTRLGEVTFSNTNRKLCEQVCELLNSLGYKAWLRGPYTAKLNSKPAGHFYHVAFTPYNDVQIFRLERKQSKLRPPALRSLQNFRTIASIKMIESVPVRCIMVDAPSQLYLVTEGFIPTHNTSLKRVDRLQWICAFPEEITILNNSATQPLAEEVAFKTALQFWRPKGGATRPIQLMFPELVVDKRPTGCWNTPNRKLWGAGDLDYTLDYTSPQTSQSGWHPLIIDYDDVEDVDNSGITANREVRENVINICDQNENTLRDGGYIYIGGTRYHPLDYYGKCLRLAEENPDNWEILVRSSVIVKTGARLLPGEFPPEDDLELQFPEFANLSYIALREKFYQNYESFMCQQQNDPQGGAVPRFGEKLYRSCLIPPERIPLGGDIYMAWRPRYGGKPSMAKYSEGAVAKVLDGKIYVLDAWQGTYSPSGEAEKIVHQAKVHQADALMIVCVPGSEFVMTHVRNEAMRRNRTIKMQWVDFEEDDARRNASMEQLEPLMKVGRVWFSTAMSKAAECQKQFVHFGLMEEQGIVEAISKFADLVPLSQLRANMSEDELEWQRRRREDALITAFLDQQGMPAVDEAARQKAEAHMQAMSAMSYGMPPLPGGLDG